MFVVIINAVIICCLTELHVGNARDLEFAGIVISGREGFFYRAQSRHDEKHNDADNKDNKNAFEEKDEFTVFVIRSDGHEIPPYML